MLTLKPATLAGRRWAKIHERSAPCSNMTMTILGRRLRAGDRHPRLLCRRNESGLGQALSLPLLLLLLVERPLVLPVAELLNLAQWITLDFVNCVWFLAAFSLLSLSNK